MSAFPACIELGAVLRDLPKNYRHLGIIAQINVAYRWGYANRLWRKSDAVKLALEAKMDSVVGSGKGHRSSKRAAMIETQQWYDDNQLTEAEIDALAEDHAVNVRDYHNA